MQARGYMRFFLLLFTFLLFFSTLQANEKISLQLKWLHQFQFAGYYAAKEKGFYHEAGLDVTIKERDVEKNNIEQVINRESEYGIADSVLFLYQEQNKPVVIVAPIFQHSPSVLVTLASSGIDSPYQLNGKRVTFYQKDTDGFGILAMLQSLGIKPILERDKETTTYRHLTDEKTDAYASYLTNEAYSLQSEGRAINIINPANYGFDLYGDMLFTSAYEVQTNPQRVQKFKDATIKGWKYALEHKEELIQIIKTKYAPNKSLEHLRYEANAIEDVIRYKSIQIGTLDRGRIQYTLDTYKKLGLMNNTFDIDKYIFKPFQTKIELTEEEKAWLLANPNIKLSATDYQKPLVFLNKEGKVDGIIAEYSQLMSQVIGQEIKLQIVPDEKDYHTSAKNPGIYGLSVIIDLESTSKLYNITKPLMYSNYILFTNKADQKHYKSLKDCSHKKIAIIKDHIGMKEYLAKLTDIEIVYAANALEQMRMLQYGEVDAILGYQTYHFLIKEHFFSDIVAAFQETQEFSLAIAVNKEYPILHSILNKAIDTLKDSNRQQILQKWIGDKEVIKVNIFTKQEKDYLQSKKSITLCIDPDWMPFEKNENGKHIGMSADYMANIEEEIGVPIKMLSTQSWSESLEFGKQRKCDIISLIMQTQERTQNFVFTQPYLEVPGVVVTSIDELFISDFSQIGDKKIAIVKGYSYGEILKEKYPNLQIVEVENIKEGFDGIVKGEFFGFAEGLAVAGYHIQKEYLGQLKIAGKLDETWKFSIGIRNDEPILRNIFEKVMEQIPTVKRREILNKWVSIIYEKESSYKTIALWFFAIVFIIVVVLLAVLRVNRILNKEIENRKEIEKKLQEISITDALTNIYNRRYFNEIFPQFINASKRKKEKVCFVILDIDYFKLYNDNYGHLSGDKVLRSVADCISSSLLRADDYCFRVGGEEFGILFHEESHERAKIFIEKIRANIEHLRIEHKYNRASDYITASLGLVVRDAASISLCEALYKEADELLYKAKESGRNCVWTNEKKDKEIV
jgi:diguanylate cyclase (GGDEF)-like protein